jgi:hypothetical protein
MVEDCVQKCPTRGKDFLNTNSTGRIGNNVRTDEVTRKAILERIKAGSSNSQVARDFGVGETTVRRIKASSNTTTVQPLPMIQHHDKKIGGINWRESITLIKQFQDLRSKASWSQHDANVTIGDGTSPVAIMFLSDMHIGAIGSDHEMFLELTDIILNTPNLYVAILGDVVEMAIKLRSVAEVCAQILDPFLQVEFMESWIEEIKHKVVFATWGNHESDRNEALSGNCPIKNIIARRVPYFSGLGHPNLMVGDQVYKMAASHKFQGVTATDCTAGCKKYLRQEYPEGEIAVQGDCHRAGVSIYNEGGKRRIAMTSGTLIRSGFSQRYFSLKTSTAFPVLALWHDKHLAVPFMTIAEYLNSFGVDAPVHQGL